MSNILKPLKLIVLLLCSSVFAACSGSSDGGGISGIEGTGNRADDPVASNIDAITAKGSVTKFGSIYVNGIHFDTSDTHFLINGKTVTEDQIKQGMVVYVKGKVGKNDSEATAKLVAFDYLLQGKIEDIVNNNSRQRSISMLGYTIIASEESMAEESAFDQLSIGDYISVSGFTGTDNKIVATRIDQGKPTAPDTDIVYLSGRITSHSSDERVFKINNQAIHYSQAAIEGEDVNAIKVGLNVKVEGTISVTTQANNSAVSATKVTIIPTRNRIGLSRNFSTEGIITDFVSLSDFTLNGIHIDASNAIITGDTKTSIGNDILITAKGTQTESNVFLASNLYIHHASATRISGAVTNIQEEAGIFTVSGINFQADEYTKFEDLGLQRNRYFKLEDIMLEDNLDIFSLSYGKKQIAVTVRRRSKVENIEHGFRHSVKIKGNISSLDTQNKQFQLMGILVDAKNIDDQIFDRLTVDTPIFVTGQPDGQESSEDSFFIAKEIYILFANCTSHKEKECKNQKPITDFSKTRGNNSPWNNFKEPIFRYKEVKLDNNNEPSFNDRNKEFIKTP